jgi:type II secretory pathway component PulJ
MNLRINLIHEDELRYAGALSPVFILRISALALLALLALGIVLVLFHMGSVKQNLKQLETRYDDLKPVYEQVRTMQQHLAENKKILEELGGWRASRVEWSQSLMDLQAIVPPSVQLMNMRVQGSIIMVGAEKKGPGGKKKPGTPARRFKMDISGKVVGGQAEEVVVQFIRTLRSPDKFQPELDSVKLQRLQKESSRGSRSPDETQFLFGIEALSTPRKMVKEKGS